MEQYGICKFCGQHRLLNIPYEAEGEEASEEATLSCTCAEARAYKDEKEKQERIEMAICSAQGTTYELFNDDYPEIERLLNEAMPILAAGIIKKVTVNTPGKTKATISFAKDTFKVEREDKSSQRRETEI